MLTYTYYCPANHRTVEVRHGMCECLQTWGELCQRAGMTLGDTPPESPIERVITGGLMTHIPGTARSDQDLLPPGRCCGQPESCQRRLPLSCE